MLCLQDLEGLKCVAGDGGIPEDSCLPPPPHTPILKAPNDDCFVVAEDLNDFMLNFSVLLCISLSPFVSQYLQYFTECTGQLL